MTTDELKNLKKGSELVYNDGRQGHTNATAKVLQITAIGMHVQFEDRADSTFIGFNEREWMDFLSIKQAE